MDSTTLIKETSRSLIPHNSLSIFSSHHYARIPFEFEASLYWLLSHLFENHLVMLGWRIVISSGELMDPPLDSCRVSFQYNLWDDSSPCNISFIYKRKCILSSLHCVFTCVLFNLRMQKVISLFLFYVCLSLFNF